MAVNAIQTSAGIVGSGNSPPISFMLDLNLLIIPSHSSCGDGLPGGPPARGDGYECGNMNLLLKQKQRVSVNLFSPRLRLLTVCADIARFCCRSPTWQDGEPSLR